MGCDGVVIAVIPVQARFQESRRRGSRDVGPYIDTYNGYAQSPPESSSDMARLQKHNNLYR